MNDARRRAETLGAIAVGLALSFTRAPAQVGPRSGAGPRLVEEAGADPQVVAAVSDSKALGYSNNHKFLVDAAGTAYLAVRTRAPAGGARICLLRSAGRWPEASRFDSAWLEDRPGVEVSTAPQRAASIALAPDGSVDLAWYGGSVLEPAHQIRCARFVADPALRVAEETQPFTVPGFEQVYLGLLTGDELWQEHPCLAAGPAGSLYLVWEGRDPKRRNAAGLPQPGVAWAVRDPVLGWSPSGTIEAPRYAQVDARFPSQSRPTIVAGAAGEMHVLCHGSVGGVQQILHGVLRDRAFSGWTVPCPSPNDQRYVSAASDGAGRVCFVWREQAEGGGYVSYASLDRGGRLEGPMRVSPAGELASTPSVAVSGGTVWVAWVAWAPGAVNSEGKLDNGFPAEAGAVEGRVEITSRRTGAASFGPAIPVEAGPAAYPTWARMSDALHAPEALLWTRVEPGPLGPASQFQLLLARVGAR
ncbi:MAG TPA: hypothetical protein VGK89_03135 [Candidatus Eisenbacteria bacterium]|jgi:hypothetical protein